MEPERKLKKAVIDLLFHHPFFGHLCYSLELVEKDTLFPPTMATDGRRLFYHPNFVSEIDLDQVQFVIAHEIAHNFLMHIPRRQDRDKLRWNFACDYAVNDLIKSEFKPLPGALISNQFANQTAEWIYGKLPESEEGKGGEGEGGTLDSHEEWDDWGSGELEGVSNGDEKKEGQGGGSQLEQQWRQAVAQAATVARMKGNLPSYLQTIVGEILQPKLDWKTILREMITSCAKNDYCLIPPNRRHLYRNIYLPGITGQEIKIAVAIDSSGSISDQEIKEFLSEVKGICDTYEEYTIHLFTCDTRIHQRFELHPMDPLPTVVEGRGGTSFVEPIKEAAKLDITSLVYLTDLYGDFGERPNFPVVWVSVSGDDVKPPWGTLIKLPRKE